jgi:predicted Fe-S protein YdhL (DUF1289 family)
MNVRLENPDRYSLSKHVKIPSPCIDICKDKRGVCIACGRTGKDKKAWKKAESAKERLALIEDCLKATGKMGTQAFWLREYERKCRKKGIRSPIGKLLARQKPISCKRETGFHRSGP